MGFEGIEPPRNTNFTFVDKRVQRQLGEWLFRENMWPDNKRLRQLELEDFVMSAFGMPWYQIEFGGFEPKRYGVEWYSFEEIKIALERRIELVGPPIALTPVADYFRERFISVTYGEFLDQLQKIPGLEGHGTFDLEERGWWVGLFAGK